MDRNEQYWSGSWHRRPNLRPHEHRSPESEVMKSCLFSGGLLVGVAIELMVGGAIVKIPADGSAKRQYPQGIALLLALVGGVGAGSTFRR